MKKIFLLFTAITCIAANIQAQDTKATFAKGDNVLGVGFGIGGAYGFSGYDTQSPVFGAHYDRGIVELGMGGVIGVGGFVGYKSIVYKDNINIGSNNYKVRYNVIVLGARGTFHYDLFEVENLDTYGAVMLEYQIVNYTDNLPSIYSDYYHNNHDSRASASVLAGAKYYFAPKVSAFAEVGYGVSWLTMGIAFKF